MKILKKGTKPEDRLYNATCNNCNSVIEFQRKEAVYKSDQRDGDYLQVSCPVCDCTITKQAKDFINTDKWQGTTTRHGR